MIGRLLIAAIAAGAVPTAALSNAPMQSPEPELKVVLPGGAYHASEVPYPQGPGWLALVVDKDSALVPVALQIEIVVDPVLDAEHGPHSGKVVSTDPAVAALLLVQGPAMQAGLLPAAGIAGQATGLSPKSLTLYDRSYSLELDPECSKSPGVCQWIFSDGKTRQVLADLSVWLNGENWTTEAGSTGLLWAGDLDRDGKLDLVVDVSDHYNAVAQVRVLLSSKADVGQLVGEAGLFSAVGC